MYRSIFIAVCFLALAGCTQKTFDKSAPKKTLQGYISKSFAISSIEDKHVLESYLTGEAKHRLATWTNAEFSKAFIDSKRKFHELSVKSVKEISPAEVELTYELSYFDGLKDTETVVTTLKKAILIKNGKEWLIREVQNIKLLVEYKEELSLP